MENKINIGVQNTPQFDQNPVHYPSQSPVKSKINLWIISTVILLVILLISGANFVFNRQKTPTLPDQLPIASDQVNQTVGRGVFRTSGLSEEEKQKFGLIKVNYQITDFGDDQKGDQAGQIRGYFLQTEMLNDELLGKCVQVTGVIPNEWKNKNKADTYNRSVLTVSNVEKIDNSNCLPYPQTPAAIDSSQENLVLRGTPVHAKRPAPDIGYDYQLKLTKPFIDKFSSSGSPQEVNLVDMTPATNYIWMEIENNLNQEVDVEGNMVWGYAESRFLSVTSLTSINVTKAINILKTLPEVQTIEKSVIKAGRKPFFTPEGETGDVVKISLRESFPDDPHITRIDTFNVNIKTNKITVEDVVSGQDISLEQWKKTVNERFL